MRYIYHLANCSKPKKVINKTVFSYGKFLRENPKSKKKQRLEAIKKFLNSTR